jgi:hypothetical protein
VLEPANRQDSGVTSCRTSKGRLLLILIRVLPLKVRATWSSCITLHLRDPHGAYEAFYFEARTTAETAVFKSLIDLVQDI